METTNFNLCPSPSSQAMDKFMRQLPMLAATLFVFLLLVAPTSAHAQLAIPFVENIGCAIFKYMMGPLAILVFIVVVVAILLVGLMAKMDWAKIITAAVIFGIIQGFLSVLASGGAISPPASCSESSVTFFLTTPAVTAHV
jgi:type IV secretory pathway VirB2 component (pilin)